MKRMHLLAQAGLFCCTALFISSCKEMEPENEIVTVSETKGARIEPETAFPGEKGIVKKGMLFGNEISYVEIDGKAVFQGDIVLSPEQLDAGKNARTESAGVTDKPSLWPNAVINYTIDPSVTNTDAIMAAIADFEALTPIKFSLLKTTQPPINGIRLNYVTFTRGRGYSSSIGRVGGQQFITVPIFQSKGAILHEIGHTVGLFHEHTRPDRLNSIKVNYANADEANWVNLDTYTALGYEGFQYYAMDMKSIMMMDSYAYSKNGQPVMTLLNNNPFTIQREKLTSEDTYGIRVMYANIYALTSGTLIAGDAQKGLKATASYNWENAEVLCATPNRLYISRAGTIWSVDKFSGNRTEMITNIAGVKSMIYAQKQLYFIQNGYLYKYNTANNAGEKFPGQYWLPSTGLAYCYGMLFIVNGDILFRVSMDGQNLVSMGSGYKGVSEMVAFKNKLYILKQGKLWKMDPMSGAIVQHGTGSYGADAQLTANTKNLLIINQNSLYTVDEAGVGQYIATTWIGMKQLSAVGAED